MVQRGKWLLEQLVFSLDIVEDICAAKDARKLPTMYQKTLALARAFQVPKTTMTHTLAGLEKAGLIAFAPNPADGRSKLVLLTQAGRDCRAEAIERLRPLVGRFAGEFPPGRIAAMLPELTALREMLDAARDA